jgi:peptidoglycan/LPS O-acetylase OafA/YrhL
VSDDPARSKPAEPVTDGANRPPYYPLFDYLRIVLAVGVFASHAGLISPRLHSVGNFCVQVFFALSGYLIGGILRDARAESLPRFYFNRSTRIWIPYFVAIALLAIATVAKHQPVTSKLLEFFFDKVTFTYNFYGPPQLHLREAMPLQGTGHHFWSICVEEQFYLLAPLVIIGLRKHATWGILALGGAASLKYPGFFGSITLGVLLALSERSWSAWHRRPWAVVVGGIALGALLLGYFVRPENYEVLSPFASVLIVSLLSRTGGVLPLGQVLGGISYPFYLNHWIGLFTINRMRQGAGLSHGASAAIALTISLVIATAHYWVIDRGIHRRRGGWFTDRRGLLCAACGFALVGIGVAVNFIWFRTK